MAGRFSIEAIFKAQDRFTRPVMKMGGAVERLTRKASQGVAQMNRVVDRAIGGFAKLGAVGAAAAVPVGAGLLEIAKTGAEFDQAMANVGAVSLMTRDQVSDLEAAALKLGKTTKFSATEVAGAMEMMGKAGYSNAEILQTIPGVLNAAAAEGMELSEAASLVSNTLKGMGLAADQTTRVADVLTLASARTNSSISSLGEAMANVSSTAHQLGVPLEDTVAAVALLQDVGLDASTAGTAVSTMLTKLATPSKEAAGQMKALGISFQDAHGNMLPFGDVMKQFGKAAEKSGGNMKTLAFFSELTGLRGQKAALSLAEMSKTGKLQDLTKELQNAAGSAEKMARLRMNSLQGDFTLLGGAVDSLKIALFNTQSGPLRGVVQGMTDWVNKNQELVKSKAAEYIQKIVDSKDDILKWGERIVCAGGALIGLKAALVATDIALAGVGLATKAVTGATWLYGLAAGAATAASESQTAATVASTIATGARTAAQWLANAAINIGTLGTTAFTAGTVTSTIAAWASNAATWARTASMGAFNAAVGLAGTLIAAYRSGTIISTTLEYAQAAATWVKNAAVTASNIVMGIAAIANGTFATSAIGAAAANGSLIASFAPFMVTVAAATAAVVALLAAWDQWKKMGAETEGLGPAGVVKEMWNQGTLDPFKAVDTYQNEQAKKRAAGAQPTLAGANSKHTMDGEITIKDQTGKAAVTKAPAKGGPGLRLAPSGAF